MLFPPSFSHFYFTRNNYSCRLRFNLGKRGFAHTHKSTKKKQHKCITTMTSKIKIKKKNENKMRGKKAKR